MEGLLHLGEGMTEKQHSLGEGGPPGTGELQQPTKPVRELVKIESNLKLLKIALMISILHADAGEDLSCISRLLNFLFH